MPNFHLLIPSFFVESKLIDPEQNFSLNLEQWAKFYDELPTRHILNKTIAQNCADYEDEEAHGEDGANLASAIMNSLVHLDAEDNRDVTAIQWTYAVKDAKEKLPKGKPFSIVSLVSTKDKVVTSNVVYGPAGKCIFQIDFAQHGENGPGHWHDLIEGELDHSPKMESHAYHWESCPWMWLCIKLDERYKNYTTPLLVAKDGKLFPYVKIEMLYNEEFINPVFIKKKRTSPKELKQRKAEKILESKKKIVEKVIKEKEKKLSRKKHYIKNIKLWLSVLSNYIDPKKIAPIAEAIADVALNLKLKIRQIYPLVVNINFLVAFMKESKPKTESSQENEDISYSGFQPQSKGEQTDPDASSVFIPDDEISNPLSPTQKIAGLKDDTAEESVFTQEVIKLIYSTVQEKSESKQDPSTNLGKNKIQSLSAPYAQMWSGHSKVAQPSDDKAQGYLKEIQKLLDSPKALYNQIFCENYSRELQPYVDQLKPLDLEARQKLRIIYEELKERLQPEEECGYGLGFGGPS